MRKRLWFTLMISLSACLVLLAGCGPSTTLLAPSPIPSMTTLPLATARPTTTPLTPISEGREPYAIYDTRLGTPVAEATQLASPTQPATPTPGRVQGTTYDDPNSFFTLVYPEHWTPHQFGSEMQFWADEQGNVVVAVSIQIKSVSAQALVDRLSDFLAEKWDNYQEVSREETTLSGYPAMWVEQSYSLGGIPQRGLMVGVVRNRVGFLLIARAPEEEYPDREADLRAVIESLQVTAFPESPPYEEWSTYEGPHIIFRYMPETWVNQEIAAIADDHEGAFNDIVRLLEVDYAGPIYFYIYTSEDSFYRATAREFGFAINEGSEVHSQWFSPDYHQSLGHEMTHVITYWTLGDPSEALLGEGIAVCLDHSDKGYHDIAADLLASRDLIPLSQMLGNAWFGYKWAYQVSGSFVCFLLDRYGVDRFKEIYPRSDFEAALEQVYGADLATLEQEWLEMLKNQ